MVFGRVLVLFPVHTGHAGYVRVHTRPAAAEKHGRNKENGKQVSQDKCELLYYKNSLASRKL